MLEEEKPQNKQLLEAKHLNCVFLNNYTYDLLLQIQVSYTLFYDCFSSCCAVSAKHTGSIPLLTLIAAMCNSRAYLRHSRPLCVSLMGSSRCLLWSTTSFYPLPVSCRWKQKGVSTRLCRLTICWLLLGHYCHNILNCIGKWWSHISGSVQKSVDMALEDIVFSLQRRQQWWTWS